MADNYVIIRCASDWCHPPNGWDEPFLRDTVTRRFAVRLDRSAGPGLAHVGVHAINHDLRRSREFANGVPASALIWVLATKKTRTHEYPVITR